MLPVDFPDRIATSKPQDDMKRTVTTVNKFFDGVSLGKISFNFRTLDGYIRVPQNSTSWGMTAWGQGNSNQFVRDVVAAVDDKVDFSGVEILVVMPPPTIGRTQIAYSPAQVLHASNPINTGEGPIWNATQMGYDAWDCCEGLLLAHEIGHLLGWEDLYAGAGVDAHYDVGQWDFMGWAPTPGLFGWHRLYQDWLTTDQVLCAISRDRRVVWLRPLGSRESGVQLLLLRGRSGSLVALEVRRPSATDRFVTTQTQGVLVYEVRTDVVRGIKVHGNRLDRGRMLPEAPLRLGEDLIINGWKVTIIESGAFGDVVEVSPS
jgi:M6 family metalloprotease-like protein